MADGYARASNKFGVCMGIGGPGISNMVTAIASAHADRSPVLLIGGKVDQEFEGMGQFQDSSSSSGIDDVAIMRNVTEFAATIPTAERMPVFLRKAMRVIRDVESQPVFISIPRNIQTQDSSGLSYSKIGDREHRVIDVKKAREIAELLTNATYIAIFAGNGTVRSEAQEELQRFAEMFSIPVVTTTRAKGAIGEDTEMSFGVFGFGGSLQANMVIAGSGQHGISKAEVVLALGVTLNENNTFNSTMPEHKHLILLDINSNSNRDIEYPHEFITADARTFLEWMLGQKEYHSALLTTRDAREEWIRKIRGSTKPYQEFEEKPNRLIHPARAIIELRKAANENKACNAMLVIDSGAHSFFAEHYWQSYGPREFFVLSTMGPMGYGISAGIGAKLAQRDKPCICLVGDGSMLMHGMELQTAMRHHIPLIVVVINNSAFGNVYLRFAKDNIKEGMKLSSIEPTPNWAEFAKSFGAGGIRVKHRRNLYKAYREAFRFAGEEKKPFVVDVICDKDVETPNSDLSTYGGARSIVSEEEKPARRWFE